MGDLRLRWDGGWGEDIEKFLLTRGTGISPATYLRLLAVLGMERLNGVPYERIAPASRTGLTPPSDSPVRVVIQQAQPLCAFLREAAKFHGVSPVAIFTAMVRIGIDVRMRQGQHHYAPVQANDHSANEAVDLSQTKSTGASARVLAGNERNQKNQERIGLTRDAGAKTFAGTEGFLE